VDGGTNANRSRPAVALLRIDTPEVASIPWRWPKPVRRARRQRTSKRHRLGCVVDGRGRERGADSGWYSRRLSGPDQAQKCRGRPPGLAAADGIEGGQRPSGPRDLARTEGTMTSPIGRSARDPRTSRGPGQPRHADDRQAQHRDPVTLLKAPSPGSALRRERAESRPARAGAQRRPRTFHAGPRHQGLLAFCARRAPGRGRGEQAEPGAASGADPASPPGARSGSSTAKVSV